MSNPHYPRQQQMKSEQGGTRWYPAHKALDNVNSPHHCLSFAEPRKGNFLRYGTLDKNNFLHMWMSIKYLSVGS